MSRKYTAKHDAEYDSITLHYAKESYKNPGEWFVDPSPSINITTATAPELICEMLEAMASQGDEAAEAVLHYAIDWFADRPGVRKSFLGE